MARSLPTMRERLTGTYRNALRRSILFAQLNDNELDAVLARARIINYRSGDQIVTKGDPGDSMMVVLNGHVSISVPSPDGRQVTLSVLHGGAVFGEIALLDGKERTADATALSECEILVIPRSSLWALLERRPDLCVELMLILCDRLRHTNQQVEDLAFLDLQSRLAKVILRLLSQGSGDSEQLTMKISQRALADLSGGTRESVNKYLNSWKDLGIISIEKGAIVIRNIAALTRYAG